MTTTSSGHNIPGTTEAADDPAPKRRTTLTESRASESPPGWALRRPPPHRCIPAPCLTAGPGWTAWLDRAAKWSGRCPGAAPAADMTPASHARERCGHGAHRAAEPSSGFAESLAADSVESRPPTTRFSVPMRQPPPSPAAAATPAPRLPGAVSVLLSVLPLARLIRLICLTCLLGALTAPAALLAQQSNDIDLVYNDHLTKEYLLEIHEGYQSAQRFTTGSNTSGYVLSEVGLWLRRLNQGGIPLVTIHQQDRLGPPGQLLYTLDNPATLENEARNIFSAREIAVLLPDRGLRLRCVRRPLHRDAGGRVRHVGGPPGLQLGVAAGARPAARRHRVA